ncbi:MAG: pseudouridine synthase [Floccifex sp.]
MERLQKVIAKAGVCSRRKAEELISKGKVIVNGEVVKEMGIKVSGNDVIEVNGQEISFEEKEYYVLHKPKGCICTNNDDKNRITAISYIDTEARIYCVGRLDYDTSGVLLLTNDGEFTNLMTHPRYHLSKKYRVNLQGILSEDDIKKIRKGIKTGHEKYQGARVRMLEVDPTRNRCQFELTIQEGKNHQVKNMMKALGYEVRRLHRVSFANITVDGLNPGQYRKLKPFEVKQLKAMALQGE